MLKPNLIDKREQFSRLAAEFQLAYMPRDDGSQIRFVRMFQHLLSLNAMLAQEQPLRALQSAAEVGFAHTKIVLEDAPIGGTHK